MFFINLDDDSIERYDVTKFMDFVEDGHDIVTSFFMTELRKLLPAGLFTVTIEEKRMDVVSYKIYGDTQYWWLLMVYNSIINFEDAVTGTELKYPELDDLESLFFRLKTLQAQQEGI